MSIDGFLGSLPGMLPVLAALGGAVSGAKFIQEGQRGLKLRFGRVRRRRDGQPRVIRPGFVFVIPSIEHLARVHVRTRTINLPTQSVMLKDRMVFEVGGVVQVRVIDTPDALYAAIYETDDLEGSVSDYVTAQLREVLSASSYQDVLERDKVIEETRARIARQLGEWGLDLLGFNLSDCSPTAQTAKAILLGAEAVMRAEALGDAAAKLAGNEAVTRLSATVAAALIGTPVATSLTDTATTTATNTVVHHHHGEE